MPWEVLTAMEGTTRAIGKADCAVQGARGLRGGSCAVKTLDLHGRRRLGRRVFATLQSTGGRDPLDKEP